MLSVITGEGLSKRSTEQKLIVEVDLQTDCQLE
jgi:hypothetical protein